MRSRKTITMLLMVALVLSVFIMEPVKAKGKNPMVYVKTNLGNFTIELYEDKAPETVKNFLSYVDAKFYGGTIFHRVWDGFMIQGGGFTPDMTQKPVGPPINNEADNGLKNLEYTVAMARTPQPHSATAQFFINVADNSALDHRDKTVKGFGYCVFGKVVEGTEVVDKIKAVKVADKGRYEKVPVKPVIIKSIARISAEAMEEE